MKDLRERLGPGWHLGTWVLEEFLLFPELIEWLTVRELFIQTVVYAENRFWESGNLVRAKQGVPGHHVSHSSLQEELSVVHLEGLLEVCPCPPDAATRLFPLYLLAVINPRL